MGERPQVRVFVASSARAKDAAGEWQEYEGPRGGEGAINIQTGEIRYDIHPDDIGQENPKSDIPEHMNPTGRDSVVSLSEYLGTGGMNENAMSVAYNEPFDGTPPLFITNTNPLKNEWQESESGSASDHGAKVATMSSNIINDVISNHRAPEHYHEEGEFLSVEGIDGFPIQGSSVIEEFPEKYGEAMGVQWLLANPDAHGGNIFFRDEENPEFVCIDLDQSFNVSLPDENEMVDGQPTDEKIEGLIKYLSYEFTNSLQKIDSEDAVNAAVNGYIKSVDTSASEVREYIQQSESDALTPELEILDMQVKISESGQFETHMREYIEQLRRDGVIE